MSATEYRARTGATLDVQEDAASRTFAHEPGEGEALWWIGLLATVKATKEQTGGRYTLVEILAPDGFASPLHVHHTEDEAFWILEGEMTFYVGDQTIKARPGSFLFGPKEVPHAFAVDSGPARLLFLLSPGGFEDLVREMGGRPTRPRCSGWPPSPPDTETRYSGHRRGSRNASPPPGARAGVLSGLGPSLFAFIHPRSAWKGSSPSFALRGLFEAYGKRE
jgi:quercetin dioxygenase-like cupin family protein